MYMVVILNIQFGRGNPINTKCGFLIVYEGEIQMFQDSALSTKFSLTNDSFRLT